MSINYVSPTWARNAEGTKRQAVATYDLMRIGGEGFNKLDWAAALLAKYDSISVILIATFGGSQASFDALQALAATMSDDDRNRLRDYIIGRLALEDISARRNGPGCGASESLQALTRCVELALTWK